MRCICQQESVNCLLNRTVTARRRLLRIVQSRPDTNHRALRQIIQKHGVNTVAPSWNCSMFFSTLHSYCFEININVFSCNSFFILRNSRGSFQELFCVAFGCCCIDAVTQTLLLLFSRKGLKDETNIESVVRYHSPNNKACQSRLTCEWS